MQMPAYRHSSLNFIFRTVQGGGEDGIMFDLVSLRWLWNDCYPTGWMAGNRSYSERNIHVFCFSKFDNSSIFLERYQGLLNTMTMDQQNNSYNFGATTSLERVVGRLKGKGYFPVHWVVHSKGLRAAFFGPGKVAVPSENAKDNICMRHGNLVKVQHETFPDRSDRGIRILDVIPCPFCAESASEIEAT